MSPEQQASNIRNLAGIDLTFDALGNGCRLSNISRNQSLVAHVAFVADSQVSETTVVKFRAPNLSTTGDHLFVVPPSVIPELRIAERFTPVGLSWVCLNFREHLGPCHECGCFAGGRSDG